MTHTVKNGPFIGLRYAARRAQGSAISPKLLGTYESELHSTINLLHTLSFDEIVNVGAGEGYYAVGLGTLFRDKVVTAYEQTTKGQRLLLANANVNKLGLIIQGKFTLQHLNLYKRRALFVIDIEGEELDLFLQAKTKDLKLHSFIIETHDQVRPNITNRILDNLKSTHDTCVIYGVPDCHKPYLAEYQVQELKGKDILQKHAMLSEYRKGPQKWIVAVPKCESNKEIISFTSCLFPQKV